VLTIIYGFISLFVWNVSTGWVAVMVFAATTIGYGGLLWVMYSKVFTPTNYSLAFTSMSVGCAIGLVVGVPLRFVFPNRYTETGAMIVSCVVAGILMYRSIPWESNFLALGDASYNDIINRPNILNSGQQFVGNNDSPLSSMEALNLINRTLKPNGVVVPPRSPLSEKVIQWLTEHAENLQRIHGRVLDGLFSMLRDSKSMMLALVPMKFLCGRYGRYQSSALSVKQENLLQVYVGLPSSVFQNVSHSHQMVINALSNDQSAIQQISEAVLHEYLETILGLSHSEATLAEFEIQFGLENPPSGVRLPLRVQQQLRIFSNRAQLADLARNVRRELVRSLTMMKDLDLDWTSLNVQLKQGLVNMVEGKQPNIFAPCAIKYSQCVMWFICRSRSTVVIRSPPDALLHEFEIILFYLGLCFKIRFNDSRNLQICLSNFLPATILKKSTPIGFSSIQHLSNLRKQPAVIKIGAMVL
jgi:predicted amino acid-binding ACT domain protein